MMQNVRISYRTERGSEQTTTRYRGQNERRRGATHLIAKEVCAGHAHLFGFCSSKDLPKLIL